MPRVEVQLPERIENEITQLLEQDEFINRDQAIEEILGLGVSAYDPQEPIEEEINGERTL